MITQPLINTFVRVGIPWEELTKDTRKVKAYNRFGFGECETTPLIAFLIGWVYNTNDQYEMGGGQHIKVSDFDRIRYFVANEDPNAYNICLD